MPDKEWTDTDWLDAGWADMERRLDEAMPVADRRRRIAFWWWWGGGAALLLLLGAWWWLSGIDPVLDYFPLPSPAQVRVDAPATDDSISLTTVPGSEVAAAPSVELRSPALSESPAVLPAAPIEKKTATAPAIKPQRSELATRRPVAVAIPAEMEPAEPTQADGGNTAEKAVVPVPSERVGRPQHSEPFVTTPNRIQVAATPLLAYDELGPLHSPAKRVFGKQIIPVAVATWRVGAEVTTGIDGVGGNGASLGALLRRTGRSPWSMDLGLRYHYWEQTWGEDQSFRNDSSADEQLSDSSALWLDPSVLVYSISQASGESYRILVARDPAQNPLVRTHWIETPLRVNYRFARRWDAALGLRPALLLNSTVSVPAVSESFSAGAPTPSTERVDLSNERVSELSVGSNSGGGLVGPSGKILTKWHLGWEAGLSYRLSPHWSLGLQYRRGQNVWQRDSELRSRTGLVGLRVVRWW